MAGTLLIDAIVRQTTVLIASLATAAGNRPSLAHVANEVLGHLVTELKAQGVGNKVIAEKQETFSDVPHLENWLSCIRSGKRPACDIEDGHRSTLLAHLGNVAYRVGRPRRVVSIVGNSV